MGGSLPPFYSRQQGCVQRTDGVRYPGEPITARRAARAEAGLLSTSFSSYGPIVWEKHCCSGEGTKRVPSANPPPRGGQAQPGQSSGASLLTGGLRLGAAACKQHHHTGLRF